jgi:hypothetical protein
MPDQNPTQNPAPIQNLDAKGRPIFGRYEKIKVKFAGKGHFQVDTQGYPQEHEAEVEDYWDSLTGGSWMFAEGNPACLIYGLRSGLNGLPTDDNVLYVKIGAFGHLVHLSEVIAE